MLKKLFLLVVVVFLAACGDDDGNGVVVVPPPPLAEQVVDDDAEIREFLSTHFYELDESVLGNPRVVIDTIAGENADKTPMIELDSLRTEKIMVSPEQLGLDTDEGEVEHTLYYFNIRNGMGGSPTVADSTFLKYEGMLLNRTTFDASVSFLWQELPFTLRGYSGGIANLKTGTPGGLVTNADGSFYYTDSGIGLIVMPSGLAYYLNTPTTAIPAYASLIFTVELGTYIPDTDNDNDGIPSINEDLNQNGYLFDDNTDLESERSVGFQTTPNFRDSDDDDDGVSTRIEISDVEGNIIDPPYPDSNNDGTPDYLDSQVARDPNNN